MPLTTERRVEVWRLLMQQDACPATITKQDFKAAADALDDYFDSNFPTMNAALPQPYRGAASQTQKVQLAKAIFLKKLEQLLAGGGL